MAGRLLRRRAPKKESEDEAASIIKRRSADTSDATEKEITIAGIGWGRSVSSRCHHLHVPEEEAILLLPISAEGARQADDGQCQVGASVRSRSKEECQSRRHGAARRAAAGSGIRRQRLRSERLTASFCWLCGLLFVPLKLDSALGSAPAVFHSAGFPTYYNGRAVVVGEEFTIRVSVDNGDPGNDRILLIPSTESCGSGEPPQGLQNSVAEYGMVPCDGNDGGGSAMSMLTCEGFQVYEKGTYKICMCDADGDTNFPGCSVKERFNLGEAENVHISIYGPSNTGTLSRRVGAPEDIVVSGQQLSSGDRIRIVADSVSCEDLSALKQMHHAVQSGTSPDGAPDHSSSLEVTWNSVVVQEMGSYRICWCSHSTTSSCSNDEDFAVDIARLRVYGPNLTPQPQACVTGVLCTLEFQGDGLADLDRIIITYDHQPCGTISMASAVTMTQESRTYGTTALSRYGGVRVSGSGRYRVCWCGRLTAGAGDTCSSSPEFDIFVGYLTVGGPQQSQTHTPALGVPFTYTIQGWGMSEIDRITIVDGEQLCGEAGAQTWSAGVWNVASHTGPPDTSVGPTANKTSVSWDGIILTRYQNYRVCWCGHFAFGCSQGEHFALTIGILVPTGAENRTMGLTVIPNRQFDIEIFGASLTQGDRIRIVRSETIQGTCGRSGTAFHAVGVCWPQCGPLTHSTAPAVTALGASETFQNVLLTASGHFEICWCNDGQGDCNEDQDFTVQVAHLVAQGVTTGQSFTCTTNLQCVLTMTLVSGLGPGDKIQLISYTGSAVCGAAQRYNGAAFQFGTRVAGSVQHGQSSGQISNITFNFGDAIAPGLYQVCYCQQSSCLQDEDFFQDAGDLTVSGLTTTGGTSGNSMKIYTCYTREICDLQIEGTNLGAEDYVMLIRPAGTCGTQDNPVGESFGGEHGFPLTSGDLIFDGNLQGTFSGLETWVYRLGEPSLVGHYGVCYCSQQHAVSGFCDHYTSFTQRGGDVYVRGTEYPVNTACQQGESCTFSLKGRAFNSFDRVLLFTQGRECSDTSGDTLYPAWTGAIAPTRIGPDTLSSLDSATFTIPNIQEAGTYNVCYCSHIPAGALCLDDDGIPVIGRYSHNAGRVTVAGTIGTVRAVTRNAAGVSSALPSSPFAASVEVNALIPGIRITCAVTSQAAPSGMVPQQSELLNCTKPAIELSPNQRLMPRCLGLSTTPEMIATSGFTLVHIPLTHMPADAGAMAAISELHVWCFASEHCASGRCVVPATNEGKVLTMTGGLVSATQQWTAAPEDAFSLRVRVQQDFAIGLSWPRVKIIQEDEECNLAQQLPGVTGIACENNAVGKCEPPPEEDLYHVTTRELIWRHVTVPASGLLGVCYCDRHYGLSCVSWHRIGDIAVSGPHQRFSRFQGSPGVPFNVEVNGLGLAPSNRLRILPSTFQCTSEINLTAFPHLIDSDYRSGGPNVVNSTYERWSVTLNEVDTYNVCWCGGTTHSCSRSSDYGVRIGTVEIAALRDCQLTDWWVVDTCSRPCGGGTVSLQRGIELQAQGGGEPCPEESALVTTQECNMEACPLARLDFAYTEPAIVRVGRPFVVHIEGNWLENAEDRVLLISSEYECGRSPWHAGGAACANSFGTEQHIICGDGVTSMKVASEGSYRICFCDATGSVIRNADGSGLLSTAGFAAAGLEATGCSNAAHYLLSPADTGSAILQVYSESASLDNQATSEGLSNTAIIALSGIGAALLISLLMGLAYLWWRRKENFKRQPKPVPFHDQHEQEEEETEENASNMHALEDAAPAGGMDMQMIAWYEAYYQSLGYPPGTATHALAGGQQQLALPSAQDMSQQAGAPMNHLMALQNAPQPPSMAPMALPNQAPTLPPPLALPGPQFSDASRPATPPTPGGIAARIRGHSPRNIATSGSAGVSFNKTFSDLIAEAQKKSQGLAEPGRKGIPAFTDMDLSPMPTPSATPRGDPTPRPSAAAEDDSVAVAAALALEDGRALSAGPKGLKTEKVNANSIGMERPAAGAFGQGKPRPGSRAATPPASHRSPRIEERPDTADSEDRASLALSESSFGESSYSPVRSRPHTGESQVVASRPNTGESQGEAPRAASTSSGATLTQSALRVHDSTLQSQESLSPVREEMPEALTAAVGEAVEAEAGLQVDTAAGKAISLGDKLKCSVDSEGAAREDDIDRVNCNAPASLSPNEEEFSSLESSKGQAELDKASLRKTATASMEEPPDEIAGWTNSMQMMLGEGITRAGSTPSVEPPTAQPRPEAAKLTSQDEAGAGGVCESSSPGESAGARPDDAAVDAATPDAQSGPPDDGAHMRPVTPPPPPSQAWARPQTPDIPWKPPDAHEDGSEKCGVPHNTSKKDAAHFPPPLELPQHGSDDAEQLAEDASAAATPVATPVTPSFAFGGADSKEKAAIARPKSLRNFGAGLRERLMSAKPPPPPPQEDASEEQGGGPWPAGIEAPTMLAESMPSSPMDPADRHMPPTLGDLLRKPSSVESTAGVPPHEATSPRHSVAQPPPPPPPPSGVFVPSQPANVPGPPLDTPDGSPSSGSPDGGWKAPSLGGLLPSQDRHVPVFASSEEDAESPTLDPADKPWPPEQPAAAAAPGAPPLLPGARPVRAPGPSLDSDSDLFEDTRGSTHSLLSQTDSSGDGVSPAGGRRKITLGGLAASTQTAAKAGSPKAGKAASSSGRHPHHKPPKPKAISGTTATYADSPGGTAAPPLPPPPPPMSPMTFQARR